MGTCCSLLVNEGIAEHDEIKGWWKDNDEHRNTNNLSLKKSRSGRGGGAAAAADALLQIPGRLFGNGASSISSLYTQQGKKGTNQDAMIVWENFSSRSDTVFCGVFDGHGPYGHMVSKRVRDSLPVLVCSHWKANSNNDQTENRDVNRSKNGEVCMDDDWCESVEVEETEKLPEIYLPLKKSILKAFRAMDKELKLHSSIDCFCSGTTAVTLVKQGQDLILGNVGDSRAVLATRDEDDALTAVQLTIDLKPNLPKEAARIQQCKGRVFALQDEPEVTRVWLPNSDSPGLAMARAFGDFCLKDFGLISVPDVYYHHLTERDEFVVLASDGVWDVLSNKEVVDVIASAPGRETAARALVDCATRAWRLKYPTSKTDDCAVVCLFLNQVRPPDAAPRQNHSTKETEVALKPVSETNGNTQTTQPVINVILASNASVIEESSTFRDTGEIVPAVESIEERVPQRGIGQSKRSLAEVISTAEDEDWSALEGITRVNSLVSISRFAPGDKRSASWKRWS